MTVNEQPAPLPPDTRSAGAPSRSLFWFTIALAVLVILVDQASKLWAQTVLADGRTIPVIGNFLRFWLVYNSGAAFSLATNYTWVITIVTAAAVVFIVWIARRVGSKAWVVALGFLLGGAATHLGDRLFRPPSFGMGHVVDFIAYGDFFIGNVADIILFCGAAMIVILTFIGVRMSGGKRIAEAAASNDQGEPNDQGAKDAGDAA